MDTLKRILDTADIDIYKDGEKYTVRIWEEGDPSIEVTDVSLEYALKVADENLSVYANYG